MPTIPDVILITISRGLSFPRAEYGAIRPYCSSKMKRGQTQLWYQEFKPGQRNCGLTGVLSWGLETLLDCIEWYESHVCTYGSRIKYPAMQGRLPPEFDLTSKETRRDFCLFSWLMALTPMSPWYSTIGWERACSNMLKYKGFWPDELVMMGCSGECQFNVNPYRIHTTND